MSKNRGNHSGMKIYWKEKKKTIEVAHLLGAGGEGEVYAVRGEPTLALKIYHEDRRPKGPMSQKLSAMEANQPDFTRSPQTRLPRVAWPNKVINLNGQVAGIVMPLVDRNRTDPISHVLNPTTRKLSLPKHGVSDKDFKKSRWKIAQNIITGVKGIHATGSVIGDVNDENILVDPKSGEISIVDCDAFQITDYRNRTIHRCKVGREQFTAPELLTQLAEQQCQARVCAKGREMGSHRPDYSCLNRQPEHDMFGIGVILFKLFMNGAHPYNQRTSTNASSNSALKDHIAARRYPYTPQRAKSEVTPGNTKLYQELPDELKQLFYQTFV